jgi:hypothetical protein
MAGMHKPGRQLTVTPDIFGSSVRNLLHLTVLEPRILWCLLDDLKICAPLPYGSAISDNF